MAGPKSVAIQGEEGSNSAAAARRLVGAEPRRIFCDSFSAVFAALDSGQAEAAVLPVENTTAGIIQEVWDRLLGVTDGVRLAARADAWVQISFVAAGLPGGRAPRRILAHPVAAAQCRRFLAGSGLEVVPCHDTAGAARIAREQQDSELAALCPPGAADLYGLEVFRADCGDSLRTWTRFLLISPGEPTPRPGDNRCLAALMLANRPGSLVEALSAFARRNLNLCSLHSRAVPGEPFEYRFRVEIEAGAGDARCAAAFDEVAAQGARVRLLGSFTALAPEPADAPGQEGTP